MTKLELLAPARDLSTAIVAIKCGADAVYIGAEHHGARACAGNSIDDIHTLCKFAHQFRVKIYVTLNTIIYENELQEVKTLINRLYDIGVDALIVQDMSLLEMELPPIVLHASTQCDIRTPEKAKFLEDVGFSQIVLPRELSLDEIKKYREAVTVPLEAFVHGALCVSYSGDCRASFVNGGRSANRGECAQICRLPYDLIDGEGNIIQCNRHLLSLKDMNRLLYLNEMINAGVSSFKIEGRLKSKEYVMNVTSAYSEALNEIIKTFPDKYCRSSLGSSDVNFKPDLNRTFNRGYTSYFLHGINSQATKISSSLSPKFLGPNIAKVISANEKSLKIHHSERLNNGDGLVFFDDKNHLIGFRVNKIEKNTIFLKDRLTNLPSRNTILYRNFDKLWSETLAKSDVSRKIKVWATLEVIKNNYFRLTLRDERGCRCTLIKESFFEKAKTSQYQTRKRVFEKTGDTIYSLISFTDRLSEYLFLPASFLTQMRREAFELLNKVASITYRYEYFDRKKIIKICRYPKPVLDMHDNVANSFANQFYEKHGCIVKAPALEVDKNTNKSDVIVMTTKHCIRRELDLCLKTPTGRQIKGPLILRPCDGDSKPMLIDFDCNKCLMNLKTFGEIK